MYSQEEIAGIYLRQYKMVFQICLVMMKNTPDAEDAAQTVFRKVMEQDTPFRDPEHEKAWLLRVAINGCKDYLKSFFRRNMVPLQAIAELAADIPEDHQEVLEAVLSLPKQYKDVIYLHYYEGYKASEIGAILGKKENTVYSLLSRGRGILKKELGGDGIGK